MTETQGDAKSHINAIKHVLIKIAALSLLQTRIQTLSLTFYTLCNDRKVGQSGKQRLKGIVQDLKKNKQKKTHACFL